MEDERAIYMKKRKIFWLIIYIAYIMWIFSNSLDIAEASSAKSSIVQQILNQFLFGGNGGLTEHVVRKMAHFSEYALAGVLGEICFQQWDKDRLCRICRWDRIDEYFKNIEMTKLWRDRVYEKI